MDNYTKTAWEALRTPDAWNDWMRQWADMMHPASGKADDSAARNAAAPFKQWLDMLQQLLARVSPGAAGLGPDTLGRMFQGAEVYMRLFELWSELARHVSEAGQRAAQGDWDAAGFEEFYSGWVDGYQASIHDILKQAVPEPLRWAAHIYSGEIPLLAADIFIKLLAPWMEFGAQSVQHPPSFGGPETGGEAITGYYDRWRRAYEESVGRLVRSPGLGYFREPYEKLTASIDSLVEFGVVLGDFSTALNQAGKHAMGKLQSSINDAGARGDLPRDFHELYERWWKTNEEIYEELFRTDEFGRLLGQLMERGLRFKQAYGQLMEEMVKELGLPLPVRSEMDELHRSVYELKKTVRKQNRLDHRAGGDDGGE
ncbi:MAG: poly(R)-hydroxyalkanoic acid synthase subunit PhaE [Candidatus Geothermincolia bacterium]